MNRLVLRSGLTSVSHGPTIQPIINKSNVWYPLGVTSNNIYQSLGQIQHPQQQQQQQQYNGVSVQVRYNFWNDFIQNYRAMIEANPEYKKSIDDFRKTFLWWRKQPPTEEELKKKAEEDAAAAAAAYADFQKHQQEFEQKQQQQQQQQGEQKEGEQKAEGEEGGKEYASKEEELREKYSEYFKDYDKRKEEADRVNKFKGLNLTKEQNDQLANAYKEAMGIRPPYPPRNRRTYNEAQDLRELALNHESLIPLPLRYQSLFGMEQMDDGFIDREEEKRFPEVIQRLKEVEQKLLEEGVDLPEIDWDSLYSYEQLEELPSEIQDYFERPPPEGQEPNNVPALYEWTNIRRRERFWDNMLDRVHWAIMKIPNFGGNYIWFGLGRLSSMVSGMMGGGGQSYTKFFFDYLDLIMPGFEINKFLPIAKNKFIPEFLELYLANDVEALEEFCDERCHKMISGVIQANEAGHKVFDSKIVRIETIDFKGVRGRRLRYFAFKVVVHHTYCIRDYLFDVVDGGDHEIIKTPMMVYLKPDTNLNQFGWAVTHVSPRPSESIYL